MLKMLGWESANNCIGGVKLSALRGVGHHQI